MENDNLSIITFDEEDFVPYVEVESEHDYESQKEVKIKKRRKTKLFKIVWLLVIFGFYLMLDVSNVKTINVVGNKFLSKDEVVQLSGISDKSKFILVNNIFKKRIDHKLLKDYKIINDYQGNITIQVVENRILGYIIREESIDLLSASGELINIAELNDYLIRLPKINFQEQDYINELVQGLSQVSDSVISRISEIDVEILSYEKYGFLLKMEDGNKISATNKEIYLLEKYDNILERIPERGSCIQLDDSTNSAFKFQCNN